MGKIVISLFFIVPLVAMGLVLAREHIKRSWIYLLLGILPVFYIGHWLAIESNEGWPAESSLPPQFNLLGASIVEPNKIADHPGAIYLWVQRSPATPPRNHVLPYNRQLHEQLQRALNRLGEGYRQMGYASGRERGGEGAPAGNDLMLSLEDAPAPELPPKTL